MTVKRFVLNVLALTMFGAFAVATVAGALSAAQRHDITAEHMSFGAAGNPSKPAPKGGPVWVEVDTRSTVAKALNVQDCPTEDSGQNSVCVWDGNTVDDRGAWLWVYGHHFHVGFNPDGSLWVDDNHDGEEGYTDS